MENKVKIELNETQVSTLMECLMVFNKVKFNNSNAIVAGILQIIGNAKNTIIAEKLKVLEAEVKKLENQKYEPQKTN